MEYIFLLCKIWAATLLFLTVTFHILAYSSTKDISYAFDAWSNRYKNSNQHLPKYQVSLLKLIVVTERSLKYFLYFVMLPLFIFYIFKVI